MNQDQASQFAHDYQTALQEFREIRRRHTRKSVHGQEFVLVSNVTEDLQRRSPSCSADRYLDDLDRLGKTAYLRHDFQPPKVRTQEYRRHLPVFYTLLDIEAPALIDQFRIHKDLENLPIALSALKSNIEAPNDIPNFHERFYERQFAWCPIRFGMEMGRLYDYKEISPFTWKEPIKPYRDGKGPLINTATLYAIEVPEELVEAKLQKRMASARISRQNALPDEVAGSNADWQYRFALKQFRPDKQEHFANEMQMFRNLENQDGMIQYVGWFRNFEPDVHGNQQMYFNIVLELAEFDFYTAIRMESPPTSSDEIFGFWAAMAEITGALASIHDVIIDGNAYLTWHGDIKPENILRVNDRFKLADPGEASMLLKLSNATSPQKAKVLGGTRSYAAPEKAAYLDGISKQMPHVPQTSDVWSLGCVLSIAATYVVLGTQGVLIYNRIRQEAIFNKTGSKSDAFHDGITVLEEIVYWHQYLRETSRKNDVYSGAVLDMVDRHMLVHGDERWSARKVFDNFSEVMSDIDAPISQVPPELQCLLENIDLQVETDYDHHSGIIRADQRDLSKRFKPAPAPKPTQANIEFESWSQLQKEKILPVAQRSQYRTESPSRSRSQSFDLDLISRETMSMPGLPNTRENLGLQAHRPASTNYQDGWESLNNFTHWKHTESYVNGLDREPMTVWTVRSQLERNALSWKPSLKSFSALVGKSQVSIRGKAPSNEEIVRLDSRIEQEFKSRDIVFLVDNGTTMAHHWMQATDLLEVLVWRSLGYDDNGVDIRFTDPDTSSKAKVKDSRSQTVRQFTEAMKLASPKLSTRVRTSVLPALERIVNDYTMGMTSAKSKPRKKTIIVLTDGIWEGMNVEYTLDVYLKSTFQVLRDIHGDLPYYTAGYSGDRKDISVIRPITIQFVQFGNDPGAAARLRRLDDDMRLYGCPDLIDTEHANGDIYKMLLGSLCSDIDAQETVVVVPSISPTMSPHMSVQNANESITASSTASCTVQDQLSLSPREDPSLLTPSRTTIHYIPQIAKSDTKQRASMLSTSPYPRDELPADVEMDGQDIRRLPSVRRSTIQRGLIVSSRYSPQSPDSDIHNRLFAPENVFFRGSAGTPNST